jgi:CAAX protease family protein
LSVPNIRSGPRAPQPAPAPSRRRTAVTLGVVIAVLVAVNALVRFLPTHAGLILRPAVACGLLAVARYRGLSWDDLGLARASWRTGTAYAAVAVVLIGAAYAVAAAVPFIRMAFLDTRYHLAPQAAVVTALVVIPLGTIVLEEVAFRGVLFGAVRHHRMHWAGVVSSLLFGVWHILPSLRLGRVNPAVAAVFGAGPGAQLAVVCGVVGFTAVAGLLLCELRRRSGSLLASAGLHWAVNALAVLVAAVLWAHPTWWPG